MSEGELSSVYSVCSDAAGVAGNLLAFVLFVSPIPTFRRIIKNRSTEEFSGLPYIYALLNCLICLWYGMPIVSSGIILIATVNSVGALFQLTYVAIFIRFAHKENKVRMLGLLLAVFSIFGIIALLSIRVFEPPNRQLFVGYLSVFSLISMFASPLFIINMVIRTKSVEYMPFYLSLATFLMSISFFAYGLLKHDPFIYESSYFYHFGCFMSFFIIFATMDLKNSTRELLSSYNFENIKWLASLTSQSAYYSGINPIWSMREIVTLNKLFSTFCVPNGAGAVLGAIQLVLYFYYCRGSEDTSKRHLLGNHSFL